MVAEGIELSGPVRALRDLGCDTGQGFLIARPMDPPPRESGCARRRSAALRGTACSIVTRRSTDPAGSAAQTSSRPLRHRDFRRLWSGMTLSLVGDGAFLVAMAWQVYIALERADRALVRSGSR